MSTPTESGIYLWQYDATCPWTYRQVHNVTHFEPDGKGGYVGLGNELAVVMPVGSMRLELFEREIAGEWGARIPSAERLEALEELAAACDEAVGLASFASRVGRAIAALRALPEEKPE